MFICLFSLIYYRLNECEITFTRCDPFSHIADDEGVFPITVNVFMFKDYRIDMNDIQELSFYRMNNMICFFNSCMSKKSLKCKVIMVRVKLISK